jgi:hypothetical protein
MKKLVIGAALLAVFTSPVLARDYQRTGTASYSMSGKMRGMNAQARSRADYGRFDSNASATDSDLDARSGPDYDKWLQYR